MKGKKFLPYKDSVNKIREGLYISKKDDYYMVAQLVDPDNIQFWKEYGDIQDKRTVRESGIPHGTNGVVRTFQDALSYWENNPVWVVYLTKKDCRIEKIEWLRDIELSFTVLIGKFASTHMGIFRASEFYQENLPKHNNSAIEIHSFAAKVTQIEYDLEYMITQPVDAMRNIMAKSLPKDMVFVGEENQLKKIEEEKRLIEEYKNNPENVNLFEFADKVGIYDFKVNSIASNVKELKKKLTYLQDNEDYVEYLREIENKLGAKILGLEEKLKELSNHLATQESEKTNKEIDKIFEGILEDCKSSLKLRIEKNLKRVEKILADKCKVYFGNEEPKFTSPLKMTKEKVFIKTKSGETKVFQTPEFYETKGLKTHLPTVIVDLKALAELRTANGYSETRKAQLAGIDEIFSSDFLDLVSKHYGISKLVEFSKLYKAGNYSNPLDFVTSYFSTGGEDLVALLVNEGVDLNKASPFIERTPLFNAVHWGNVPVIKLLLNHGANINHIDANGKTVYDYAIEENRTNMKVFLEENVAKLAGELNTTGFVD